MRLSEVDILSGTWQKLSAHLKERIELNRKKNDSDLDPIATAKLRARIKELQYLLSLAEQKQLDD